jgi:hypothetical protein
MKSFFLGVGCTVLVAAAAGAYVWWYAPEHLPAEWRRENPRSRDYAPLLYRWKDDQGIVQLTDTPPAGRPYESLRIDPDRNVVPLMSPAGAEPR